MFWFYRSPYIRAPWYNNWYGSQYTNITRYDEHTFSITSAVRSRITPPGFWNCTRAPAFLPGGG
jgi:hypothetical protein